MMETWYVTFPIIADGNKARNEAMIWGVPPGGKPPPAINNIRVAGPFASRADAEKYKNAIGTGAVLPPGGTPIVGSSGRGLTQTAQDLFHGLDLGNILLRIGEVLLGIVLVGVGVAKLTGVSNSISDVLKVIPKVPV